MLKFVTLLFGTRAEPVFETAFGIGFGVLLFYAMHFGNGFVLPLLIVKL